MAHDLRLRIELLDGQGNVLETIERDGTPFQLRAYLKNLYTTNLRETRNLRPSSQVWGIRVRSQHRQEADRPGPPRRSQSGPGPTMAPAPGKYEGELLLTAVAHGLSMHGGPDEECGSVESTGWYGLMRGPFGRTGSDWRQWREEAKQQGGTPLTAFDNRFLREQAGVILYEGSQGFVSGRWYTSRADLDRKWQQIEQECGEAEGQDEGEGY